MPVPLTKMNLLSKRRIFDTQTCINVPHVRPSRSWHIMACTVLCLCVFVGARAGRLAPSFDCFGSLQVGRSPDASQNLAMALGLGVGGPILWEGGRNKE